MDDLMDAMSFDWERDEGGVDDVFVSTLVGIEDWGLGSGVLGKDEDSLVNRLNMLSQY